jgi:MarR family transcriptional regulator, organic hydroperoxide resistance regulator
MIKGKQLDQHYRGIDNYLWVLLQRSRSVASRVRNLELAQFGLNIEQMSILHSLAVNGGSCSVEDISSSIIRQKNSVTTLVERMCKLGLVTKQRQKADKKYRIFITDKGREALNKVPMKSIDMLFSEFEPEEKEKLAEYLEKVISMGQELLGKQYFPPFLEKTKTNTDN